MPVFMRDYMCRTAGAWGGQTRASDTLEVELQAVVSHLLWVLAPELGSFARAVYPRIAEPFLQVPRFFFFF